MRFVFANHVLDVERRELRRGSELVRLDRQVFDLLIYLIENRHRVVSAAALAYYGQMLSWLGRREEGVVAARRALRLGPRDPFSAICSGVAAGAEFLGGNYHEAMRLAREAIRQRTDLLVGYRVLTAAAAMAGEIELAKASLQELRRVQPDISLGWIAVHVPVTQDDRDSEAFRRARDHYLEAYRRAGME